jgi:hypothetical protein
VEPSDVPRVQPATASPPASIEQWRQEVAQLAAGQGFERLRDGLDEAPAVILRGTPSQWQSAAFPTSSVHRLSLEDIFIALASEVSADI